MNIAKSPPSWQWTQLRTNVVPQQAYSDPSLFRAELERIYAGPLWHPIVDGCEIAPPGDFKTAYIGEVPIVVTTRMAASFSSFSIRA